MTEILAVTAVGSSTMKGQVRQTWSSVEAGPGVGVTMGTLHLISSDCYLQIIKLQHRVETNL